MTVVELNDHRKIWLNFQALCTNCCYEWTAVVTKTAFLECPECGQFTGGKVEKKEE